MPTEAEESEGKIYFNPKIDILYFPHLCPYHDDIFCVAHCPIRSGAEVWRHFSAAVNRISSFALGSVEMMAVHESVFLELAQLGWGGGSPRISTEERMGTFWMTLFERFENLRELTITGKESAVLADFVMYEAKEEPSNRIRTGENVGGEDLDMDSVSGGGQRDDDETLYKLALRTYWELRRQEPHWVAPMWRVWKSSDGSQTS